MAKFQFEINGKTVIGTTLRVPNIVNVRFESYARCPICNNKFTAKSKATVPQLEASVKSMMKRHYDNAHRKK